MTSVEVSMFTLVADSEVVNASDHVAKLFVVHIHENGLVSRMPNYCHRGAFFLARPIYFSLTRGYI